MNFRYSNLTTLSTFGPVALHSWKSNNITSNENSKLPHGCNKLNKNICNSNVCSYSSYIYVLLTLTYVCYRVIPFNPKYESLVAELQQAIQYGAEGGTCDQQYSCSSRQNNV